MTDKSLKRFFDVACAHKLAEQILPIYPSFDAEAYAEYVDKHVDPLELKDRVMVLAQGLRDRLPDEYPQAVQILVDSLGTELGQGEGMLKSSYYLMPVSRFVEEFGLDYPHESLCAIEEITRRHTGEFAVRPYLWHHRELTMTFVRRWSRSESLNVRRLSSEGIRIRLPWATRFQPFVEDPTDLIEVLNALIDDESVYVRKSVANNLNDISSEHPELALSVAQRWLEESPTERTQWIVNHGLRTLIKAGNPVALSIIGAGPDPAISVGDIHLTPQVISIGEAVTLNVSVHNGSHKKKDVIVDYVIHFLGKDGHLRPKVFKMARVSINPKETVELTKHHVFKRVSTRTYYPGVQKMSIQVGGVETPRIDLVLKV